MCRTQRPNLNNEFRWQEVACSPECGQVYLRAILESRNEDVSELSKVSEEASRPVGNNQSSNKKSKAKLSDDKDVSKGNAIE